MKTGPRIPIATVSPLSARQRRIYEVMRPTGKRWSGRNRSASELAAMVQSAWHAAGYYSVTARATTDASGTHVVASNLIGGLPPDQNVYEWKDIAPAWLGGKK